MAECGGCDCEKGASGITGGYVVTVEVVSFLQAFVVCTDLADVLLARDPGGDFRIFEPELVEGRFWLSVWVQSRRGLWHVRRYVIEHGLPFDVKTWAEVLALAEG